MDGLKNIRAESRSSAAAPEPAAATTDLATREASVISEVERVRRDHPNLVGVRGWLLWFCIGATIITPAFTLYSVFADHPSFCS